MSRPEDALLLCCLLWAHPGQEAHASAYEDRVLTLLADHGADVLQRVRGDGTGGHPLEVQLLRFPSRQSLDAFIKDPRRAAMSQERDRVIARTELFGVERA